MLFLRLLNAKIVFWLIIGIGGAAGALYLRVLAVTDALQHATVQQAEKNREGIKHLRDWRLK